MTSYPGAYANTTRRAPLRNSHLDSALRPRYNCATGNGSEREARLASAQAGCAGLRTLQCVVNVADVDAWTVDDVVET